MTSMGEFPASVRSVRFGVFEVDLRNGELKKKGTRIRLQGQPFLLLVTLLKQRGRSRHTLGTPAHALTRRYIR
jgi:hypothetical protein